MSGGGLGLDFDLRLLGICMGLMDSGGGEEAIDEFLQLADAVEGFRVRTRLSLLNN